MDSTDRMLIDRIQRSFPLVPEPYRILSEGLDIDGAEVRKRIGRLKEDKMVRQVSAIFNTGALGYRSSLVALAVPGEAIDATAEVINSYPGVSHNYLRPGSYNMWFTIAVPPGASLEGTVKGLSDRAGGWPYLILPALRKYKLAVVLDVLEEGEGDPVEDRADLPLVESTSPFQPTPENVLAVRRLQEDLPLVERPFALRAEELGMSESDLLDLISLWLKNGVMRRFAAVLNHRQVGFRANGMVVWNCPTRQMDECGKALASYAEVSHCYYRPAHEGWPYNLYAMVHGRSVEECQTVAARLAAAIDLPDFRILFSTREFKKIRLKLFWD